MSNGDIIQDLLKKPFRLLSYEDKLKIIRSGKPQPALPDLQFIHQEKTRSYIRHFNVSNYKKYLWLAGSESAKKLFCWPCLLFSIETSPWTRVGFDNLNYLATACDKHAKSISHIKAFTKLQTFENQRIEHALNRQNQIANNLHNEKVRENRNILKRLIDVAAFLGKQDCAFRSVYVELLEFLSTYDSNLANLLKTPTDFKGTSPLIQNDLIGAVASVIRDKIKSEIAEASYVSILLDETTDVSNKSLLSTVVRYMDKEGHGQERFLHFTDVSADRTAQGLFGHVAKVVHDLDCSEKLVAQTFDGAIVMAGHVEGLQTLIRNKYPAATFIHSYSHRLDLILSKSTTCITECRLFFASLSGIPDFFVHCTVRTRALKKFMDKKLPDISPTTWNFSSQLVTTVKENRLYLIEFFKTVEDEPNDWTSREVTTASSFVRFLSKFDTNFFLSVYHKIFTFSDILFDALQNKGMDLPHCINKVNEFSDSLRKIRNDFEQIWAEAESLDNGEPRPKRQKQDDRYKAIFNEILDTLMTQTELRFDSQKSLKFVSLLDSNNFDRFNKAFPEGPFAELKEPYVKFFDKARLKNELKVLYSLAEYNNKSVEDFTVYLKLDKLDIVFSEVYKLAELICTFPSTTATVERTFSALKWIRTYLRPTQGQTSLSNLGVLSIEKDILTNMRKYFEDSFYEKVTQKFTETERRIEFMYK